MLKRYCTLVIFCILFSGFCPLSLSAQNTKPDLVNVYTKAIGDFIKAATSKNKQAFDTLFIAMPQSAQPGDSHHISLPKKIENTRIKLISPEAGKISQQQRPARIYINLIGWFNLQYAEFIFVVFTNGFNHQYDYHLHYTYNPQIKYFELDKTEFKGPPFDK